MRKFLFVLLCFILFFIPFFWLKPGEMDLGGDTSRLYFYDPLSYLSSLSLFGISSSGVGGETISYYGIPYIYSLALLKKFFSSPTTLISLNNGLSLSLGFVSVYLFVKELLKSANYKKNILEYSALVAGLFYVFSPTLILGWDKAILTHNQVFLNPLIGFLNLKFLLTRDKRFLIFLLLITFIFSHNFDYVAAPPFFAFFPLTFLFIFLYVKYIRKLTLRLKDIVIALVLFILLHAYHLLPHIMSLTSSESSINNALFSETAKFSRGLDYFSAIAPSIKPSLNFMNLPQMAELGPFHFAFIIFPVLLFIGFLWNNGKSFLLSGIFFLITFFFVTASITTIGLNAYKSLFHIPGFSMFRNFFGQWAFVFIFFYSLLLGQALAIITQKIGQKKSYFIYTIIVLLLTLNSWPFLNGSLFNKIHWQSKQVKITFQMDPEYEDVLTYFRTLPIDGKVLSFPLPGPGYQILAGKDGGAYQGPSTISYLAGKNDFTGYDGLIPFNEIFIELVKNSDYSGLEKLFSILNIKYIFHNSDPYIYDDTFPKYPYDYVRDYMPNTQNEYEKFLKKLPIKKVKSFGGKYHIYEVKNYLPHIYTADSHIYASDALTPYFGLNSGKSVRSLVFTHEAYPENNAPVVLEAKNTNPLNEILNNYHLHVPGPFISKRSDNILYPFVVAREKNSLRAKVKSPTEYIDFSLLYLSKRVLELEKYKDTPITHKDFVEPKLWELHKWKNYYSWESNLTRYESAMQSLILWTTSVRVPESTRNAMRIRVNQSLYRHEMDLSRIIGESNYEDKNKKYLTAQKNKIFGKLYAYLDIKPNDISKTSYRLELPKNTTGKYETFLKSRLSEPLDASAYTITLQGNTLNPIDDSLKNTTLQFDDADIRNQNVDIVLKYTPKNLTADSKWNGVGTVQEQNQETLLSIDNQFGRGGFSRKIAGYRPNTQYVVTFDYYTEGADLVFKLYEKQKGKDKNSTTFYFNNNLSSKTWKTVQSIVNSAPNSLEGHIHFSANSDQELSKLHIKNLSVSEVSNERLIFSKIVLSPRKKQLPKIKFKKINSTKYKIYVYGAKDPYFLVFSEAFNRKWKVFTNNKKVEPPKNISVSYFNGEINELEHTSTFINSSIFETLEKDVIDEKNHFLGNGYANAWKINPADVGRQEDYELILEFYPQRNFYIFFLISLTTAFSLLIYLLISFKNNHEKN